MFENQYAMTALLSVPLAHCATCHNRLSPRLCIYTLEASPSRSIVIEKPLVEPKTLGPRLLSLLLFDHVRRWRFQSPLSQLWAKRCREVYISRIQPKLTNARSDTQPPISAWCHVLSCEVSSYDDRVAYHNAEGSKWDSNHSSLCGVSPCKKFWSRLSALTG